MQLNAGICRETATFLGAVFAMLCLLAPALRADDLQRIADAEACMAIAEEVSLAEYTQAEKK